MKEIGENLSFFKELEGVTKVLDVSSDAYNALEKSLDGLTTAQILAKTSTVDLTDAQKLELIELFAIDKQNYSTVASLNAVDKTTKMITLSTGGLTTAFKGLGATLKSFFLTNPWGWAILAVSAIAGIVLIISKYNEAIEESKQKIRDAADEAKNAIDEINSTFENTKSTVKEVKDEYAKLAQEVKNLGTLEQSQGTLSTDEYERFLDLSNQLADLFPQLTKGYDDNGNAILDLSGNVNTITNSLEGLVSVQQKLANQEIIDKMPKVWDGYALSLEEQSEKVKDATNTYNDALKALEFIKNNDLTKLTTNVGVHSADTNLFTENTTLNKILDNAVKNSGIDKRKVFSFDYATNEATWDFTSLTESQISKIKDAASSIVATYNSEMQVAKQNLESTNSEMKSYMETWLNSDWFYLNIQDSNIQNVVKDALLNTNWASELPKDVTEGGWEKVSEWVESNFLYAIGNINDEEIKSALVDVYGNSLDVDIQSLMTKLLDSDLGITESNPLIVYLQTKLAEQQDWFANRESWIDKIRQKMIVDVRFGTIDEGEFQKLISQLSDEDLEIAANLEVSDNEISSWERLIELIEAYKSARTEIEDAQFKGLYADVSSLKDLIEAQKEIEESGRLSFETISELIETYPELESNVKYTTDGFVLETEAIQDLINAKRELYELDIQEAKRAAATVLKANGIEIDSTAESTEAIITRIEARIEEINAMRLQAEENISTSIKQKQAEINSTQQKIKNLETQIANTRPSETYYISKLKSLKSQAESELSILYDEYRALQNSTTQDDTYGNQALENLTLALEKLKTEVKDLEEYDSLFKDFEEEIYGDGSSSFNTSSTSYFDFIEIKLENLNDELEKTKEQISDTFNWDVRDKALDKSITDTNILIEQQRLAMKRYMEEAEKSGLPQPYVNLIQQGKIDLLKLSNDDPLKEQIDSYQEWYEKAKQCDEAITQLKTDLDSLYDDKRTLKWEIFDYLEESISRITDEADYLIELLSNEDLFDDKGNMTKYANVTIGLHASNYNTYIQQAKDYVEEIKDLESQLATGGQEVLDKYNERVDAHQDAILAAQQEKQAILDLVEEGYNSQLEVLNDIIDKKKEALNAEKDLYDYQQSITEKTQNIATLEKRRFALSGDSSEEARAQLQQIDVELEKARQDLEETEMEKNIEEREKLLDNLSSEYETWMNERIDNSDSLLQQIIDNLSADGEISKTLKEIANSYGTTVSDSLSNSVDGNTTSAINNLVKDILDVVGVIDIGNVGGYASGTKSATKGLHWFNEKGEEIIIRKADGAILQPFGQGDMVFNNESSKRLWEFSQNPSAFMEKFGLNYQPQIKLTTPNFGALERRSMSSPSIDLGGVNIICNEVNNPQQIANEIIHNKTIERAVLSMVDSAMTGKNSLSKFKY